jgi:hypothetical protein
MLRFFCTRCGTELQVELSLAGGEVRCPHCRTVVRTPEGQPEIPLAERASPLADLVAQLEPMPAEDEGLSSAAGLVVPVAGTPVWRFVPDATALAEQLEQVDAQAETDGEPDAMTECPHCDSTIAPYLGRCPFCRHPLRGS